MSFRAGKYEAAVQAYSEVLRTVENSDAMLQSILSNPSAAHLALNSYQMARRDASRALQLIPDNEKARHRLLTVLFHLRSYQSALDSLLSNSVVALNNAMEQWSYSNCDGSYFNCNEIKAAL